MKLAKVQSITKPMRVDFVNSKWDFKVAVMGLLGYTTRFISSETGLTPCQVNYRLHHAHVKRADYRNGTSAVAKIIYRSLEHDELGLISEITRHLDNPEK